MDDRAPSRRFEVFFAEVERPVRVALCARFGVEIGREAAADAFAYAWEHWDRVQAMTNPAGYVYRVGERLGRRARSTPRPDVIVVAADVAEPAFEPALRPALARLSPRQRVAVVLVHGLGFTQKAAAGLLGIRPATLQKHAERGLAKLRNDLGVDR